jgi:hypothetical protein
MLSEGDCPGLQWYTMQVRWSKAETTEKKQRFKVIQEALLRVRDMNDHLRLGVQLPVLPLSIVRGTTPAMCEQRAKEFTSFLQAALAHRRLRLVPALLQLLAPDDTTVPAATGAALGSTLEPSRQRPQATSADTSATDTASSHWGGHADNAGRCEAAGGAQALTGTLGPPPPVMLFPHRANV